MFISAQCYQAQQNKIKAIDAYEDCLVKDCTNVEAFNRLIDCQLVTGAQKERLLGKLNFGAEDQWLRKIYESKVRKVEEQLQMEEEVSKDNIFQILVAKENINILCIKAKTLYQNYQIPLAYELCLKAIKKDPLCF